MVQRPKGEPHGIWIRLFPARFPKEEEEEEAAAAK